MYNYRKMTPEQRQRVLDERKTQRRSWHAPPHLGKGSRVYMISAACFEHRPIMATAQRRTEFMEALLEGLQIEVNADIRVG